MTWVDKLIGWISPQAGALRAAWRQELEYARSGYDAAGTGRLSQDWRVAGGSAESTDAPSRELVRSRARDLERNSDMAMAVVRAYERNVVGRGFTLQARTEDETLNERIEALWTDWTRRHNCDITGQQSFTQMQRMLVRRKKIDGGMLIKKCYTAGGLLPLKLQCLEVDELSSSWLEPKTRGNRVVGGIEYDPYNRPAGYWIQHYSVDGLELPEPEWVRASDVIFYYTKTRPSQVREFSDMAVSMTRIRDANEFMTAVSVKERIAACLAVLLRRSTPAAGIAGRGASTLDKSSYDGKTLTPGMIMDVGAADSVDVVNPGGSSAEASGFLATQQRLIGAGQGLAYETMTRDMSNTNYSSARQAMVEDEITFYQEVELLQENVLDEVYESFLICCVVAGVLDIPDFWAADRKRGYMRHEWIASKKAWIDPGKEAGAQKTALENGLKTYKQIAAENGRDWREMLQDSADVAAYAKALGVGVVMPGSGGRPKPDAKPDAKPAQTDEDEDEDEA